MVRFSTAIDFCKQYNPSWQLSVSSSESECIEGEYPTLKQLELYYNDSAPIMWLVPHLFDLSEYCGCKEKLSEHQLEECATIIAQDYFYLKVSELALFFRRMKAGKYGQFYGSVDPQKIAIYLRSFIRERAEYIQRKESDEASSARKAMSEGAVTYEEYLRMTGKEPNQSIINLMSNQKSKNNGSTENFRLADQSF